MDDLLTIGEFSVSCGLSPKMLRSYAAAGLLVPIAVDAWSGYRYYSPAQVHRARVVAALRRAGIGVEEIAGFLDAPDPRRFAEWDERIRQSAVTHREALALARELLREQAEAPGSSATTERKTPMAEHLSAGAATDAGGRADNEDIALVGDGLFAVADGLGGLSEGALAARTATETLAAAFAADATLDGLISACREANRMVWQRTGAEQTGTTLTAFAITSDRGPVFVHAGDSRLYRMRDGLVVRLTRDHTVTAELVETGALRADLAATHPHRRVLTRAFGVGPSVEVDYAGVLCRPGDRMLLCTDGAFEPLSAADLTATLRSESTPRAAAEALVRHAVRAGTEDNATALVVDIA
ncbi:MerR family transcriptional regulator [Nocardia bovistercoris]|uniref:MerR family transcriptional regulator n=1 Tax=Nocardia bovistercoris TaxID=2785916 RepID=A0A931IB93_9NOCA|nr:MerR family transcriptional regulator [Nocardia bovistercoris]MBH0777866.1 MerR family transcriptional regulator [Nocardia bovistercoris]